MSYVCPMHPEIKQDTEGRCPKCGMKLVSENRTETKPMKSAQDRGLGAITWKSYMPLIVVISLICASTLALTWRNASAENVSLEHTITYFMTGFFLVFAGFKLIDLKGFAEGYSTYDLLAQRWFAYGYIYPFIELSFGLVMLAGIMTTELLWAEFLVMAFSGLGVAIKIARREEFMCACLGTFLKVPLTYVTLIEDFGMAFLALVLILIA